jgi:hypothetical protein
LSETKTKFKCGNGNNTTLLESLFTVILEAWKWILRSWPFAWPYFWDQKSSGTMMKRSGTVNGQGCWTVWYVCKITSRYHHGNVRSNSCFIKSVLNLPWCSLKINYIMPWFGRFIEIAIFIKFAGLVTYLATGQIITWPVINWPVFGQIFTGQIFTELARYLPNMWDIKWTGQIFTGQLFTGHIFTGQIFTGQIFTG